MGKYAIVGKSYPIKEAKEKAMGEVKFTDDLSLPHMLYGKILRSPLSHGQILNLDISKAERISGVKGIITGKDIGGLKYLPLFAPIADQEVLATEKVRFMGEALAAVAAMDEDTAEEALELIQVDYEELPPVVDPEEAIRPGAPKIHDHLPGNMFPEIPIQYGDLEKGLKESDYVKEDRFVTQLVVHSPIEPHASLASFDPSGKLTFWSTLGSLAFTSPILSRMLNIQDLRVIKPCVGGSFGGKGLLMDIDVCSCILAKNTARPVKMVYTREEEFVATNRKSSMIIDLKSGFKRGGTWTAWQCQVLCDGGAYAGLGMIPALRVVSQVILLYRVPHIKCLGRRVYTNKPPCGAQRGPGTVQACFAIESHLDTIARELGIDPVNLKVKNLISPDGRSKEFIEALGRIMGDMGKDLEQKRPLLTHDQGVGMAVGAYSGKGRFLTRDPKSPLVPQVHIKLREEGKVTVYIPTRGQLADTMVAQVAAEAMGLNLEDVKVMSEDLEQLPVHWMGGYVISDTGSFGKLVQEAAEELKEEILEIASEKLEANKTDLVAEKGRIFVKGTPEKGIKFSEAAFLLFSKKGGPIIKKSRHTKESYDFKDEVAREKIDLSDYSFSIYNAQVDVDRETGRVKVQKVTGAFDCGFAINPQVVEGQIQGGIGMGISYALWEGIQEEKGQPLNPSLLDYRTTTAMDVIEIEPILVECPDPEGAFGAKACGEGTQVNTAPAIANAIYDAIGVRVKTLPLMPEKILEKLEKTT